MATTATTTSLITSSAPANTMATDTRDQNTSHETGATADAAVPASSGSPRTNVNEETVAVTSMTTVTTTVGSGLMTPLTTSAIQPAVPGMLQQQPVTQAQQQMMIPSQPHVQMSVVQAPHLTQHQVLAAQALPQQAQTQSQASHMALPQHTQQHMAHQQPQIMAFPNHQAMAVPQLIQASQQPQVMAFPQQQQQQSQAMIMPQHLQTPLSSQAMWIPQQLQAPMQSQAMAVPQQLQLPVPPQARTVPQQLQVPVTSQAMAFPQQLQVPMQSQAMAVPQQLQVPVPSQARAVPQQLQVPVTSLAMAFPQQLQVPVQYQVTAVPTQLPATSQPQVMAVPYQPQPPHIVYSQMQPQTPVAANSSHGLAGYISPGTHGTLPALVQPLFNMPPPAVSNQLQSVASSTCQSVPASYGYITPVQGYQQTATQALQGQLPTLAQVRHASDPQQYSLIGNSTATAVAGIEPRAPVNNIHRTSIRGKSIDIFWPDEFVHRSGVSDICFDKLTLPEVVCGTLRIIETTDIDQDEISARNQHIIDLMILAEQFQWNKVRSLYHEVLSMIQQGRRPWSASIKDLKDEMLRTTDQLVTQVSPRAAKGYTEKQQTCRQWNFGKNGCPRMGTCQYRHICAKCAGAGTYTDTHQAKECQQAGKPESNSDK